MPELDVRRNALHQNLLDLDDTDALDTLTTHWVNTKVLIEAWWKAYKDWEAQDDFNTAVLDNRMTSRSFSSEFDKQVNKTKPVGITKGRFFDDQRNSLPFDDHTDLYDQLNLPQHKRGLNTSDYANPANFASRQTKYQQGLHDLSVRLLVPGGNIKATSHHAAQPTPHFCFFALSKGEDQFVIYKLIQYAKALKTTLSALDTLIRGYRSQMTRVKLANDYDMGTGYIATPTPGRPDLITYKVKYGLGRTLKQRGVKVPPPTTPQRLQARQTMYFNNRADIVRYPANEVIISLRQHAGPFPVLAIYESGAFSCFDIANNKLVRNGRTITATGHANW